MHLLVSVTSAVEASAALAGGADLIDAKDPSTGALGAVSIEQFRLIVAAVAGARPVTAALGDAADEPAIEQTARAFAGSGASFVKIGFAGIASADRVAALIAAAVRGATSGAGSLGARAEPLDSALILSPSTRPAHPEPVEGERGSLRMYLSKDERLAQDRLVEGRARVVAVAYADADRARSISFDDLVEAAARTGANGVLLDTFDKQHGGLRELVVPRELAAWVSAAHRAGLFVAVAGKLTAADLPFVRDAGADIAGVRGAACEGGRTGRVVADRVRRLRSACEVPIAAIHR